MSTTVVQRLRAKRRKAKRRAKEQPDSVTYAYRQQQRQEPSAVVSARFEPKQETWRDVAKREREYQRLLRELGK